MTEDQKSYRQIFKATSIFGGVQVFNVIISIVRSKVIALLLGPAGMGVINLLISTTGFISSLTNFGLGTSAIKNVAVASETEDNAKVSLTITVLRKLLWVTGVLGMLLTIIFSPLLSKIVFGSKDHVVGFIWISISVLFQQLTSGKLVVLQGLRKLKYLAKANLAGSFIGLLFSLPIFYFWRIDGIVPVIILSSLISLGVALFFEARCKVPSIKINIKKSVTEGKEMLTMGFIINLSTLIAITVSFLVRIYLRKAGGIEEVGLYTAGFAIINSYVSMIFTAMNTDYYPRLSEIAHSNSKSTLLINQEAEIATLILAPIIILFLVFANWAIILLYSHEFVPISSMIQWAAMGMFFKVISWSIATIFLAKGASKMLLINEFSFNCYTLLLNIIGYEVFGLEGLGISFLLSFLIYAIQLYLVAKVNYGFKFNNVLIKTLSIQFMIGLICFVLVRSIRAPWSYVFGGSFVIISTLISVKELNKRTELFAFLKKVCKNRIN